MKSLFVGLLLITSTAHADIPAWSTGPTVAFTRFGFVRDTNGGDASSVTAVNAGAGWSLHWNVGRNMLPMERNVCPVSIDFTALASLQSLPSAGGMDVAVGPSFWNGVLGVEIGVELFRIIDNTASEGLFALNGGKRAMFFLLNINIGQFEIGGGTAPPGALKAALPRSRFNYFN
jgi:hypothetical protein